MCSYRYGLVTSFRPYYRQCVEAWSNLLTVRHGVSVVSVVRILDSESSMPGDEQLQLDLLYLTFFFWAVPSRGCRPSRAYYNLIPLLSYELLPHPKLPLLSFRGAPLSPIGYWRVVFLDVGFLISWACRRL